MQVRKSYLKTKEKAHLRPGLNIPTDTQSPEGLSNSKSPQVSAESVQSETGGTVTLKRIHLVRAHQNKRSRTAKQRERQPRGARAPQPLGCRCAAEPPSRSLAESSSRPSREWEGTARTKPRRPGCPVDFPQGATGLARLQRSRTQAAPGERKTNSSHLKGAEELGGAGAASVSPTANCRQRKRRYQPCAPCKHRDPEVGERDGGNAFPGTLLVPGPSHRLLRLARNPPIATSERMTRRGAPSRVLGGWRRPTVALTTATSRRVPRQRQVFVGGALKISLSFNFRSVAHWRSDVLCVTFIEPRLQKHFHLHLVLTL